MARNARVAVSAAPARKTLSRMMQAQHESSVNSANLLALGLFEQLSFNKLNTDINRQLQENNNSLYYSEYEE